MSLTEFTSDFMDAARREYESRGNQVDDDDNEAAVDELLSLATADQEAEELARRADEEAYIKRLESGEATSSTTSVVLEEVHVQSQGISPRSPHFYLAPDVEIQSESEDVGAPQNKKTGKYQRENDNGDANAGEEDDEDGDSEVVVKKKSRRHYPSPGSKKSAATNKRKEWIDVVRPQTTLPFQLRITAAPWFSAGKTKLFVSCS